MSVTPETDVFKSGILHQHLADLLSFLQVSAQQGTAAHDVELGLWQRLLQLGHTCLGQFLAAHGSGDLGETITVPTGERCQRLEEFHARRYVSIFGEFRLRRAVYGSREGQKITFIPLDNRLQLPASAFSYVLQDWDQSLCVEQAFAQVNATIARILKLNQTVASLEQINHDMAEAAESFLLDRPAPPPTAEGAVVVLSGDGKGIVMRRPAGAEAPPAYRTKGEKASQKRMATVGTVYTIDRYVRTPEQVVAALFRDGPEPEHDRPRPQHKQVWASLPRAEVPGSGTEAVFAWMLNEVAERNPGLHKEMVFVGDGQDALWTARAKYLPQRHRVDILDLLHVTPRLWQAAHSFHAEGSAAAEQFVRERVLRILQGKVAGVIRGLREMATKQQVHGAKKKTLTDVCRYLQRNQARMRYDVYLEAGYPIASGAIEGACRHLIKDRLERAGMHWTVWGAQAMLDVRSVSISGAWEEFQQYWIERETYRRYPHRNLVSGDAYWTPDAQPQFAMAC
jgi:hypothetical protein